jgi:hypothetical protein
MIWKTPKPFAESDRASPRHRPPTDRRRPCAASLIETPTPAKPSPSPNSVYNLKWPSPPWRMPYLGHFDLDLMLDRFQSRIQVKTTHPNLAKPLTAERVSPSLRNKRPGCNASHSERSGLWP